jgi:hypothetical protein
VLHTDPVRVWFGRFNGEVIYFKEMTSDDRARVRVALIDYEQTLVQHFPELPDLLDATMSEFIDDGNDPNDAWMTAVNHHVYANDPALPI